MMSDAIRRTEIARRVRAGEPVAHLLDEEQRAAEEAFRASLADEGPDGVALLGRYDALVRQGESGVYAARMAWHSCSPAQRRVLLFLAPGRVLVRSGRCHSYYDAIGGPGAIAKAARLDTVRNLAARELVAWNKDLLDPEARAVLTERGRFVLQHKSKEIVDGALD